MTRNTSILLPASHVDFFLKDKTTISAARWLEQDWRFARVKITVREGDVEDAIGLYAQNASPDILFVETDTTADSFVDRLGALSGNCSEKTGAVVIGPVNDVNLYRSLTSMGVSDYLVSPVPGDILSDVIVNLLIEKLGASGSSLIAVLGAKGGVGTTTIAQMLGVGYSRVLDQKTMMLDFAGGHSSMGVALGFEPLTTVLDVAKFTAAKDQDSLRRVTQSISDKLSVIATGQDGIFEDLSIAEKTEDILNTVLSSNPVVIVDLSGASPSVQKTVLTRANHIVLASQPTLSSLRSARAVLQEIGKMTGDKKAHLVVSMKGLSPKQEVATQDIKAVMEIEPIATIAFSPDSFLALEQEGILKISESTLSSVYPLLSAMTGEKLGEKTKDANAGLSSLLSKLKKN